MSPEELERGAQERLWVPARAEVLPGRRVLIRQDDDRAAVVADEGLDPDDRRWVADWLDAVLDRLPAEERSAHAGYAFLLVEEVLPYTSPSGQVGEGRGVLTMAQACRPHVRSTGRGPIRRLFERVARVLRDDAGQPRSANR
jgi:hypothetical protein